MPCFFVCTNDMGHEHFLEEKKPNSRMYDIFKNSPYVTKES